MRNTFTLISVGTSNSGKVWKLEQVGTMKVVMQQFDCTSCPRLPTYTVVQSGLFSGFSLLPASWLASIAAEYNQANGKISSEEDPYWLKFLSLIMWHDLHLTPIIQYKHGKVDNLKKKTLLFFWS